MKTPFLFFLLVCIGYSAWSQPIKQQLLNDPEKRYPYKKDIASLRWLEHLPLTGQYYYWDGINWIDAESDYAYTYNSKICALASDTQYYQGNPISLNTHSYVDDGFITQYFVLPVEHDHYSFALNNWLLDSRQIYSWDDYGYGLAYTSMILTNGVWDTVSARIYERTFDNAHRPLTRKRKTYSTTTHQFTYSEMLVWQYYPDSSMKGYDIYTWNGVSFEASYRYTDYAYNFYNFNNGVPMSEINYFKYQTYNGGTWEDANRYYFSYDGTGSDSVYAEVYDTNTGSWSPYANWIDVFDSFGNYIHFKEQLWEGNDWVTSYEYEIIYMYDGNDNPVEIIYKDWDYNSGMAVNNFKFNYSDFITCESPSGIEDPIAGDFKVFPNPSSGEFNIQLQKPADRPGSITVYDITGRQIHSEVFPKGGVEAKLYLTSVPAGIFLLKITSGFESLIQKIEIVK